MERILIICSSPGIRRAGKEHPAREVYDKGVWTDKQLEQIANDPAFTVLPVSGDGVLSDDSVPKEVLLKVQADLNAANDKIADLEQQLVEAKKPKPKKGAAAGPETTE